MARIDVGVKVDGAKELRREIRRAQDQGLKRELKEANRAASQTVAVEAKTRHVPIEDGHLEDAIRALGSQSKAQVKAGGARNETNRYAGVIHFGDPNRGIRPQPFLFEALARKWDDVYEAYEAAMRRLARKLST